MWHKGVHKLSGAEAKEVLKDILDILYPPDGDKRDWDNLDSGMSRAEAADEIASIYWERILQ